MNPNKNTKRSSGRFVFFYFTIILCVIYITHRMDSFCAFCVFCENSLSRESLFLFGCVKGFNLGEQVIGLFLEGFNLGFDGVNKAVAGLA